MSFKGSNSTRVTSSSERYLKPYVAAFCYFTMDENKKEDGHQDAKVDLNDPNEVSYAAQEAGITSEKYKEYAQAAGTNGRLAIARYIRDQIGDQANFINR